MHKKRIIVLVAVVLLLVALAVAVPVLAKNIVKHNEQTIYLKIDETATIHLEENPTTGYAWHWDVANTSIVRIESEKFIAPSSNLIGAPGNHVWEIAGLKAGKTQIVFEYYRSWESNKVDKTITYTFIVQ